MKTDKNTVIGFILLGVLFFVFFWYTNKQQQAVLEFQKQQEDSIARVKASQVKPIDTATARLDSLRNDSLNKMAHAGGFTEAAVGTEKLTVVENKLMRVTFTNKGGVVKQVEMKNYNNSLSGKPVVLGASKEDVLGYNINTANNTSELTSNLYFTASAPQAGADGTQTITFSVNASDGRSITHQYIIKPDNYAIDWNVGINGANQLLTGNTLNIQWHQQMLQNQNSVDYERQMSNICFSEGNDFDYISSKNEKDFDNNIQWVSVVQQFFNVTLIAKNNFNDGSIKWARETDSSHVLSNADVNLQVKLPATASVNVPMQLYYGPNDYQVLKNQAPEMDKIVNLGRDMYAFVRPINKYIIMPVFNFFASFISNYGWVILLLTLFIRLVTSPLVYTSYLSGAKMKVLRPELDTLKKKFGSDQQGFAMEQMKLFREAGVNPLGGCIPALLQIPIFFALYSFFNSNIALRGKSFLWSDDLSAYDSIIHFPVHIWGLGDHLSLFTITAITTSFLISIYNMSMTPTQDNPALKYMPYIFPFILLFVFNKLPSALTWYYTVSNLITLILQFTIQNYIIDHDKILAQIDAKRKAPKTKSKWSERYQQMMESQKKLQDMKQKNQGKK